MLVLARQPLVACVWGNLGRASVFSSHTYRVPTEQALLSAFWGYTGEQNKPKISVLTGGLALT